MSGTDEEKAPVTPEYKGATKIRRGRFLVWLPVNPKDLIYVHAADETKKGGGFAFTFTGTRRELQALRTALTVALTQRKAKR